MKAMQVMSALSQQTRLDVYTRLVASLPEGMAAGELATATKTAPTAMSPHLAILSRAGLVKSTKVGRSIIYRAVTQPLDGLVEFLSTIHALSGSNSTTEL
ncbi:helix-turn-helix transcriptional regulator [Sphingomonas bacterium]|uniref:ArsR/SmtB family transcription factor n=1 Tax=Sphingomonas bacterium TaxID=1895847 RepID=UPI00157765DB|nr:metalloregulator ArsR/SmtB family transcription factor [Sphingomonas bacterium]